MTNDGKFILDGKRVKFSDYGGSSFSEYAADGSQVGDNDRLDFIESEIGIMFKIVAENHLALMKIEKRIAIMQEKIDGID